PRATEKPSHGARAGPPARAVTFDDLGGFVGDLGAAGASADLRTRADPERGAGATLGCAGNSGRAARTALATRPHGAPALGGCGRRADARAAVGRVAAAHSDARRFDARRPVAAPGRLCARERSQR